MADVPGNVGQKQGGRFRKGTSGNPAGRPPGARNRATLAAETLLDGQAEALTTKAVALALDGDSVALRLCLERVLPPRRDRPIMLALPPLETAADAPKALAALVAAVADGTVTASEAADMAALIERFVKAIEASDLDYRLSAIEKQLENRK